MTWRRFYRRHLQSKDKKFAGFRWQIERSDGSIFKHGRFTLRDIKLRIRRKNKLSKPVYSDYMTVKIQMKFLDLLLPDKRSGRAMNDVYEVKVWKGGKPYGDVTYHKTNKAAFRRFNGIVVSLMKQLKEKDHAKSWRPPKR